MALVLETIHSSYKRYFYDFTDHRSEEWFLVRSPPISIMFILTCYVLLVKYGPKLMEQRKEFELKNIMIIYNFAQVVSNLVVFLYGGYVIFLVNGFNFRCQEIKFSSDEQGMIELKLTYAYFLLKIFDLLDTVFFVLRKKNSHLSFLHCYHHFFMVLGSYIAMRWLPGGPPILLGCINTFVHVIVYFYYLLTAFNPELKNSIWWKKHITQIQLLQFAILAISFGMVLATAMNGNCGYPKFWLWVLVIQNTFFLVLFGDFYRKSYLKKPNKIH